MTQGTNQREQIYIYDTCQKCQEPNVLVYEYDGKLLCAEDSRHYIRKQPHVPFCDMCGKQDRVVRDPSHRRNEYLCMDCHVKTGFMIVDTVTNRVVRSTYTSVYVRPDKPKTKCYVDNADCDNNVKPRGPWNGRSLCDKHGKIPPKREKTTKS
jgi:hypothetical protein